MDKVQAIDTFWNSFGLVAYDESTVPDGNNAPTFPYITYNVSTDSMDNVLVLNGSIWYRSSSWKEVSQKAEQIARAVGERGYKIISLDDGYLWITKGTPFAQRMSDPDDDMVRRVYITLNAEFLTAY